MTEERRDVRLREFQTVEPFAMRLDWRKSRAGNEFVRLDNEALVIVVAESKFKPGKWALTCKADQDERWTTLGLYDSAEEAKRVAAEAVAVRSSASAQPAAPDPVSQADDRSGDNPSSAPSPARRIRLE